MTAENPLIDELCKGTHHNERAAYSFGYQDKHGEWRTFYIKPPGFLVPKHESENNSIDPLDLL